MNSFAKFLGLFCCVIGITMDLPSVSGFKIYQNRIPNGDKIPDPCRKNQYWNGVGHRKSIGGGQRNPFGTHFRQLGKVWDKTLCQKDSDGDGRTNGEELGDPDCSWSVGKTLNKTNDLSHPGICEPLTSEACRSKNDWLDCTDEELKCDAFKEKGVKNIALRFPLVKVARKETIYVCMLFKLPTDGDYHIIGEKPIIGNDYVLHHMVLFGCKYLDEKHKRLLYWPKFCDMTPIRSCDEVLSTWTFGSKGHCGSSHAGFRIGVKGYKYAAIQIHWNNPEKRNHYFDNSGLILFYTANLRQFDAGVLTVGQMDLAIPPNREHFEVTALCDGHCLTTIMLSSIYVIESSNHMHYLGKAEKVELFRNNKFNRFLSLDDNYNYDNPVTHPFETPIEILKGDELKTTCVFQSNNTNVTTYFGEDTASEMCFAFLHYYPKQNLINNYCLSYRSVPLCQLYGNTTLRNSAVIHGCIFSDVLNNTKGLMGYLIAGVMTFCKMDRCVPKCIPMAEVMLQHPCFQGDLFLYMKYVFNSFNPQLSKLYYSKVDPCVDFLKLCHNCTAVNLSAWYSNDETTSDSEITESSLVTYPTSHIPMNSQKTTGYTQQNYTDKTDKMKTTKSEKSTKLTTFKIDLSSADTLPSTAVHHSYEAMICLFVLCSSYGLM